MSEFGAPSADPTNILDFSQVEDSLRHEVKRRLAYVEKALENKHNGISGKVLEPVIEEVAKKLGDTRKPSVTSLYRWIKEYIRSEQNIFSLVPKYENRGNTVCRLNPKVLIVIEEYINEHYKTAHRPTMKYTHQLIIAAIDRYNQNNPLDTIDIPSYDALYRYIHRLDPYDIMVARFGKNYADKNMTQFKKGFRGRCILERVEMDHTIVPMMVVDEITRLPLGRPYLTVAIDTYSRSIIGFYLSFEPPSLLSVYQCLKHALFPKEYIKNIASVKHKWNAYGIPETLVVDNGKEFHSPDFYDTCLQIGINVQYAPPKTPWFKPAVERHFRTINQELLANHPGNTFCNIFDKKDYDPVKHAVISYDALIEMVHVYIVDIYQQEKKRGTLIIPFKEWEKSAKQYPPTCPESFHEISALLGRVEERTVSAKGIEFEGLLYNSPELLHFRTQPRSGEKRKIKYNPSDLSRIHIVDSTNNTLIEVPAIDQEYTEGLSLWQHRVCRRYALNEFGKADQIELAHARARIQDIVMQQIAKSKKRTNKNVGRWNSVGLLSTAEQLVNKEKPDEKEAENKKTHVKVKNVKYKSISSSGNKNAEDESVSAPSDLYSLTPQPLDQLRLEGWGAVSYNSNIRSR